MVTLAFTLGFGVGGGDVAAVCDIGGGGWLRGWRGFVVGFGGGRHWFDAIDEVEWLLVGL